MWNNTINVKKEKRYINNYHREIHLRKRSIPNYYNSLDLDVIVFQICSELPLHSFSAIVVLELDIIVFQICSELPLHTFYATVYVIPAYFLAGLTFDVSVFFQVYGLLYLMIYCSRSLAMLSSAILPNFQLSCFFAQTFFSLFIMSAGFFINLDNIFSGTFGI